MFQLNNILVCLDLTRMDEFVVGYARLLASTMKSSRVTFIHVNVYLQIPADVREKFPELYGPMDRGQLPKRMEKTVSTYFPNYLDYNPEFIVREGSPSQEILGWSGIGEVDLIIMGKKSELKGKGVNPTKIANISHCSVLFVPENSKVSLCNIFVPVDFFISS